MMQWMGNIACWTTWRFGEYGSLCILAGKDKCDGRKNSSIISQILKVFAFISYSGTVPAGLAAGATMAAVCVPCQAGYFSYITG
jgi:hypothetical protein